MVDVMLLFTVTDKSGFLDCSKLTKMPALMPVGSSIIIHGPDDLEIEASISGYYWGDDESFIRVQTRECKITAGVTNLLGLCYEF